MRVLMVEDSRTMRIMIRQALEAPWPDVEIVEAESVGQAREILGADASAVDLILLDCNLPGGNGLALLDHVGAQAEQSRIPVLMVSAETENAVIISALRKGARGYLTKPFETKRFHRMLREHLGAPSREREAGAP